jgi:hypothetical protein
MTAAAREQALRLPPRWFIRSAWVLHRAIYAVTGGRLVRSASRHSGDDRVSHESLFSGTTRTARTSSRWP